MTITNGTEKQIAWATTIKTAALASWGRFIATLEARRESPERTAYIAMLRTIADHAATCTDARAWIDARSGDGAHPGLIIAHLPGYATSRHFTQAHGMDPMQAKGAFDALAVAQ